MANWYTNSLIIGGKETNVKEVLDAFKKDQLFDRKMIPPPENLRSHKLVDWRYENWFCKVPFVDIKLKKSEKKSLQFEFYSSNGTPIPFLEKISEKFPSVTLKHHCYSMLDDFMGEIVFEKGKGRDCKTGSFEVFGIKNEYIYQDKSLEF